MLTPVLWTIGGARSVSGWTPAVAEVHGCDRSAPAGGQHDRLTLFWRPGFRPFGLADAASFRRGRCGGTDADDLAVPGRAVPAWRRWTRRSSPGPPSACRVDDARAETHGPLRAGQRPAPSRTRSGHTGLAICVRHGIRRAGQPDTRHSSNPCGRDGDHGHVHADLRAASDSVSMTPILCRLAPPDDGITHGQTTDK